MNILTDIEAHLGLVPFTAIIERVPDDITLDGGLRLVTVGGRINAARTVCVRPMIQLFDDSPADYDHWRGGAPLRGCPCQNLARTIRCPDHAHKEDRL